ncbi:protein amalgam [Aplysia californica]|uniref:Protein amalgam n=1 Tax=Aplysia californica TaxID=6500 RepID=A0ABM0JTV4_APLCA|nr:protein amalgam [Aplysia californica]
MVSYAFIILAIAVPVLGDDPKVRITGTDPPLHPVEGVIVQQKDKDVQLTCFVENKPLQSEVQWTVLPKNSTVVQIATATRSYDPFRWSIDNPSSTAWRLRIQNAQVTDEGIYTCKVQVVSQNYNHDSRELRIVQTPKISDLITSSDMTKKSTDPALFECYATGRPEPLITWTRLAGELLPNGGTEFRGNVFRIEQVTSDHAGVYKCTASNSAGSVERKVRLTVNFRPEVYAGTPIVRQKVGYVKELVCNVKGYPQPSGGNIRWTHEGMPILNQGRFQIRNIPGAYNRITSILEIKGVHQEDFGSYRCAASNSLGSQYTVLELVSSNVATPTRNGQIISSASSLSFNLATLIMLISVWLLQRGGQH